MAYNKPAKKQKIFFFLLEIYHLAHISVHPKYVVGIMVNGRDTHRSVKQKIAGNK